MITMDEDRGSWRLVDTRTGRTVWVSKTEGAALVAVLGSMRRK